MPGGYFILHLVNRDKFDPILNTADPLHIVSAQKYAKKRITNSLVKFKDFQYKANFELDKENNLAEFKEDMIDDKTKNVRQNNMWVTTTTFGDYEIIYTITKVAR